MRPCYVLLHGLEARALNNNSQIALCDRFYETV